MTTIGIQPGLGGKPNATRALAADHPNGAKSSPLGASARPFESPPGIIGRCWTSSVDVSVRSAEDEVLGAIGGVPAPPTGATLVRQGSVGGPEGLPRLTWTYRSDLTGTQIARHYQAVLLPDGWVEPEAADTLARFERTVHGQRFVIVVRVAEASTFEVEVRAPASSSRRSIRGMPSSPTGDGRASDL